MPISCLSRMLHNHRECRDDEEDVPRIWPGFHNDDILSISYYPPNLVATSSYDGDIKVWNMETGNTLCVLNASRLDLPDAVKHVIPLSVKRRISINNAGIITFILWNTLQLPHALFYIPKILSGWDNYLKLYLSFLLNHTSNRNIATNLIIRDWLASHTCANAIVLFQREDKVSQSSQLVIQSIFSTYWLGPREKLSIIPRLRAITSELFLFAVLSAVLADDQIRRESVSSPRYGIGRRFNSPTRKSVSILRDPSVLALSKRARSICSALSPMVDVKDSDYDSVVDKVCICHS